MNYPIIIHGSENSLDKDAYVVIPKELPMREAKTLCDSFKEINANLIVVQYGKVAWCYKGTEDECNNSILATYHLHKQTSLCPVIERVERNYGLKMVRTIRGILSYNSRTEKRDRVKKALSSPLLEEKISLLKEIDFNTIADFEKTNLIETYKFLAFQMGQCYALIKDNKELFTKNEVANYYPSLKKYVNREVTDATELQKFYKEFVDFISQSYKKIDHHNLYVTNFHGKKEVIDCKKEIVLPPVVVFDIDGTLMDERHRREHMDNGRWEQYFDLCHLDTPFTKVVELAKSYRKNGYEIWLMTGRSESCKEKTIQSMQEHGVPFDHLKMRGKDVFIPDYVLKPAWISKYIGKERVETIYDDRDEVIEGFRKKGLNVIDVKNIINAKSNRP